MTFRQRRRSLRDRARRLARKMFSGKNLSPISRKTLHVEPLEDRRLLATLTVNSALDNLTGGDGLVTLREAIIAANGDSATDLGDTGSGADEIVFDAGLNTTPIVLSITGSDEDAAATGDLDITTEVIISGNGAANTIIDAGGAGGLDDRVLHVLGSGNLTLNASTISGGDTTGTIGLLNGPGGGVFIDSGATGTINNSSISENTANYFGGGLSNKGSLTVTASNVSDNDGSRGGGISSRGTTLTINDSTISGNNTGNHGAGLYSANETSISNSTISNNTSNGGGGGGIFSTVGSNIAITIADSTISGNSAAGSGGGILVINPTSTLTITNSTIANNTAALNGGGVYARAGDSTITHSTVSGNLASVGVGGGVWNRLNMTVTNSTLSGNSSGQGGGGLFNTGFQSTVTNSTITGNTGDGGWRHRQLHEPAPYGVDHIKQLHCRRKFFDID